MCEALLRVPPQGSGRSEREEQVGRRGLAAHGHGGARPAGPHLLLPPPRGGAGARGEAVQAALPEEQTEPLPGGGAISIFKLSSINLALSISNN